jgi:hypothetical protein
MKHIAFLFTSGDSWTSKAIRAQTWGDVNHTAFEFVDDGAVIQIQSPKVLLVHPSVLINASGKLYRFVIPVEDRLYDEAFQFAKDNMVGKSYDKISVARFLIPVRAALGKLDPLVRKATAADWFCSEGSEVLGRKCEKGLVRSVIEPARISPQQQFISIRLESTDVILYQEYQKGELLYSGPLPMS